MEATSSLPRPATLGYVAKIDWDAVWTWLLGFGLVVYLGLKGGGYDPLVHDQAGIAVWWVVLAGVAIGAFPRRRLGTLAWCALGLFAAFAVWTALSLGWTDSADKTAADVARVATYLGVLVLALLSRGSKRTRRMVAAVGSGVAFVALVGLLSRLHPAWFPEAEQTARFLTDSRNRLSYPLNYWNGMAGLVALGLPAMLQVATCAKSTVWRSLAAGALPALVLALFLTLSRGGIAAALIALAVFFALTYDRLPKLLTALVAAAGGAILVAATAQRHDLHDGLLTAGARHQGNEILAMTIVVCAGVALLQAGITIALANGMRPEWTRPSRRRSLQALGAAALVVVLAALALGAPGRAANAWDDFKAPEGVSGHSASRLDSFNGNHRYQLWGAAVDEQQTRPLAGTGGGTFEYWWAAHATNPGFVRDTHSLYLQSLGELGIVGLALIVAFLGAVLVGGARVALRASRHSRPQLAAALAGCVAFCVSAAFDWVWQIPAIAVAFLLLASALAGAGVQSRSGGGLKLPWRIVGCGVALAAIVAIALPLASATLVRQSQDQARADDLGAALASARSARNVAPGAAAPRLQEALVLEAGGRLGEARAAAGAATRKESVNWRNWLVLSRIEAELGQAAPAVRDYRRARSLNPESTLFER
jgi:hypothetical protein